jgi:hypothetical protein
MIELGLRLHASRRLRWADRLRLHSEYEIRLQHQAEVAEARVELITEQRDVYQERARRSEERTQNAYSWYRSPAFWFAVGIITAGVLVALAAWGLSAAGD